MNADYRVKEIFTDEETHDVIALCYDVLYGEEFEKLLGNPEEYMGRENAANLLQDSNYEISDEIRADIEDIFGVQEFNAENDYSGGYQFYDFGDDEFEDDEDEEEFTIPTVNIRRESFNLREALNRIDLDTYNRYDLLNLYEACALSENEKRVLANIVYDQKDPEVIYDTLNDRYVTGKEVEMPERVKAGVIHEDSVNEDALNEGEYWTSDAMLRNRGSKKGMSKELETRFNDTFYYFGRSPQAFEHIATLLGETIQFVIDECGDTQKDKEIICKNTNNRIHGGGKLGLGEVKKGIESIQTYLTVRKPANREDKLEKINTLLTAIFNFQTKSGSIGPAHYDPEDMAWLLNNIRYAYIEYTNKPNNGIRTDKKSGPKRPQTVSDEEVTAYTDELLSNACENYKFSDGKSPYFFVPERGAGVSVDSNGLAYLEVQLIEYSSRDNIEVYISKIPAEYVKDIKTFKSKCEKMILDEFERQLLFNYDGLKKVNESITESDDAQKAIYASGYTLEWYENIPCRDRRPTTIEDVKNCYKVTRVDASDDYDALVQSIAYIENLDKNAVQEDCPTIEDCLVHLDDKDWSDGSPFICKLYNRDNVVYDSGENKETILNSIDESKSIEEDRGANWGPEAGRFELEVWVPGSGGDDDRERHLITTNSIQEIIEVAYDTDLDSDECFLLTDWKGIYRQLDQCYDAEELEDAIYNDWGYSDIGDLQKTLGRILLPKKESVSSVYKDVSGIMGEPNATYSEEDLKNYWDSQKDNDPSLRGYSNFNSWLRDTLSHMEEISEQLNEEVELDRKNFASLVKDREGYFVLVDGNFERRIIADTDEEAIEKFRATLTESPLNEAPSATLSDDDLFDPRSINFKSIIKRNADAEEKARKEQERQERIAQARETYKELLQQVEAETDTYKALELLFNALVPSRGKADTIAGELVRAIMRIVYRDWNDGDKFFCGYGIETCGSSAQYLMDMSFDSIDDIMDQADYYVNNDDAYTKAITNVAQEVVNRILENPFLLGELNDVDSREYDCREIEEKQPRFEYDFQVPYGVVKHIDAGNITDDEVIDILESNLDSNNIEYEEVYFGSFDYITIYGLTYDGYEEVQRHYMYDESYWSYEIEEWDDQYGDPEAEEDEEDPEEEDSGES